MHDTVVFPSCPSSRKHPSPVKYGPRCKISRTAASASGGDQPVTTKRSNRPSGIRPSQTPDSAFGSYPETNLAVSDDTDGRQGIQRGLASPVDQHIPDGRHRCIDFGRDLEANAHPLVTNGLAVFNWRWRKLWRS